MKDKKVVIAIEVGFVVAMMIGLLSWEIVSAQECRIIKIHGRTVYPNLMVEPETIWVSKGDCVVWFNRASAKELQITFEEGKKCLDVTQNPQGSFTLDAKSCFVSTWVPFAGTSSLRFMEPGTYNYVLETKERKGVEAKGQIIVE